MTKPHAEYALAFETSGAIGSVALGLGQEVLETREFTRARAHAAEFFPSIADICESHGIEPASISYIFVSAGPGSFTGLRVGITSARAIASVHGAKIVAVPTLEVIAQNAAAEASPPETVAVVLDAKRNNVYASAFRLDPSSASSNGQGVRYTATTEPTEVEPEAFLSQQRPDCAVMGEGVLYHRDAIERSGRPVLPEAIYRPRAEIVYKLGMAKAAAGAFVDRRDLIPVYIRPPEAEEKWAARHS